MNVRKLIMDWAKRGVKIKRTGRMCEGCAFRKGTPANASDITIEDAAHCLVFGSGTFHCHLEDKVCTGFQHAKQYTDTLDPY